jgi:hypothetical protein
MITGLRNLSRAITKILLTGRAGHKITPVLFFNRLITLWTVGKRLFPLDTRQFFLLTLVGISLPTAFTIRTKSGLTGRTIPLPIQRHDTSTEKPETSFGMEIFKTRIDRFLVALRDPFELRRIHDLDGFLD